jgi:drug/metabolite transporter (DMT)-like permease
MVPQWSPRARAVLQALFVTFLWSTSWVLIKIGLADLPALTFAGLRYGLAALCLAALVAPAPAQRAALRALTRREWARLAGLGLIVIAAAQGAQFLGLAYLPALTVSLLLNCTPVLVAGLGLVLLAERPTRRQWLGVALFLAGVGVYFYPVALPDAQAVGVGIVIGGVAANAVGAVLGRGINRAGTIAPLLVTLVSMSVGAAVLLSAGVAVQGLPALGPRQWAIIGWLAVVNTAFAFTLWNRTLRTLAAVESSLINSTMLVQVAVLAWLFLGEPITGQGALGMALAGAGVLLVQLRGGLSGVSARRPLRRPAGRRALRDK